MFFFLSIGSNLPSHLAANIQENRDQNITTGLVRKIVSGTDAQACNSQGLIPPHISQIYDELFVIHQKLQVGTGITLKILLSNVMKILTFDREFRNYLYTKLLLLITITYTNDNDLHTKSLSSSASSPKLIH